MIPLLTYPLALIAAFALPALVAVYFFRSRFRRQPVSSLMLWRRAHQPREGGARLQRFTLPLAFIIETMVVILLVVAAADPRLGAGSSRKPLVVVLDDSVSMCAGLGEATPQKRAIRELYALCARPDVGSVRFVVAGKNAVVLDPVKPDAPSINRALKQWKCTAPGADLGKALELARGLGRRYGRIVVLTDRALLPELVGDGLLWLAFGQALPNVGLVNAARSAGENKDRCMLEVANYSDRPAKALLAMEFGAGVPAVRQVLDLSAGELKRLTFDLPPQAGNLQASLPDDVFAGDNKIVLLPQPVKKASVAVDIADPGLRHCVQKALDASGLALPAGTNPNLVIVDRPVRAEQSPGLWTLRFDAGTNALSYTGPFVVDAGHPLTRGLDLEGVIWGAGSVGFAPGFAVVSVGNIPVVNDQVFPSGRHDVRINLRLGAATLQNTPNWPILFWNLLRWRADEAAGLSDVNVRAGAEVFMRLDQPVPSITVRSPDGAVMELKPSRRNVMFDIALPGIYHIVAHQVQYALACNLLAPEESDLRGSYSGRWGRLVDEQSLKQDYASLVWMLLLAALGLLVLHLICVRS